jgi:hypothetical protein
VPSGAGSESIFREITVNRGPGDMSETKIAACPVLITKLPRTAPSATLAEPSHKLAALKRHWWAFPVVGMLLLVCFSSKLLPRRHWSAAPQAGVAPETSAQVIADEGKPTSVKQDEAATSNLPAPPEVHDPAVQQPTDLQVIDLPPLPTESRIRPPCRIIPSSRRQRPHRLPSRPLQWN